MAKFRLSGKQKKELNRGNELQIVLPDGPWADGFDQEFLTDAALELLGIDSLALSRASAVRDVLTVYPLMNGTGLQAILGQLALSDPPPGVLSVRVEVVIVAIAKRRRVGSTYPPQWPGRVQLADGSVRP